MWSCALYTGPQVTEAAGGFAWLPVSWRLEIAEPSPRGLELLALGRQSYGSQSWNSPGGAGLGRDEPRKMWVPGGFRGGSLLCLGPRVSFTFWKLQATHLTVQLWLEAGNSSACLVHSCTPEQVRRKCLMKWVKRLQWQPFVASLSSYGHLALNHLSLILKALSSCDHLSHERQRSCAGSESLFAHDLKQVSRLEWFSVPQLPSPARKSWNLAPKPQTHPFPSPVSWL